VDPTLAFTVRQGTVYYQLYQLFEKSLMELSQAKRQRELRLHADMPAELLERIVQGCLESPLLTEAQKKMILNEEENSS